MTDLEFLKGEAAIANASAPRGATIRIEQSACGRMCVLINRNIVASLLSKEAALACIMGIGGAFAFVDSRKRR